MPLWTYPWTLAGVPFPWGRNHSPSFPPPSASGVHGDLGDHLPLVSSPTLLPSRPTSAAGDSRSFLTRGCRALGCSRRPGGEVGAPLAGHPTRCPPSSRPPSPTQIPRQLLEGPERLLPTALAPGPAARRWLSLPGPAAGREAQPPPCPDLPVPPPRPRPGAPGKAPAPCACPRSPGMLSTQCGVPGSVPALQPPARCPAAGGTNSACFGSALQSYALGSTLPGVHPEGPVLLRSVKAAAPWHGHQSRTARALQG